MAGAHEALEHAEHAAHAGHGHGEHGKGGGLGTYIGLTMGILGVLLAFASAKVGGERTELVQAMVNQESANARYQSQDVKHRMAFLTLAQMHAMIPADGAPTAPGAGFVKKDVVDMGRTVQRYLQESALAKAWLESYDPAIKAHIEAQEEYEHGLLLAEIGIVIASISLLLQKKAGWFISIALGVGSVGIIVMTYMHTTHEVHEAEEKIEETGKIYRDTRNANKTTAEEEEVVADVMKWGGVPVELPKPASAEPEHGSEHAHGH